MRAEGTDVASGLVFDLEVALDQDDIARARRALTVQLGRPPVDATLELLASRAASGSNLAAELLIVAVDRTGLARSAVRQFLLDETAIDDVVQDTLITLAQAVAGFRGEARFLTWFHRLARNRAVDHIRRARSSNPLETVEPSSAERISSLVTSRQAVRELLEQLPDRYRRPVVLRDLEHRPYAEIAERLGENLNTVKSQVVRGRALLAAAVEREGLR